MAGAETATSSLRRRLVVSIALVLLLLILAGYASSALSRGAAQGETAEWATDFFAESGVKEPLRWIAEESFHSSFRERVLDRDDLVPEYRRRSLLLPLRQYEPVHGLNPPYAYALAELTRWPYVVRVDYGCFARGHYGKAGTHIYLALFGRAVLIADWPMSYW